MAEVFNPSKFYDERVNKYGYSAASVGWKDSIQQNLRFDILIAELDLNNKKILFPPIHSFIRKINRIHKIC